MEISKALKTTFLSTLLGALWAPMSNAQVLTTFTVNSGADSFLIGSANINALSDLSGTGHTFNFAPQLFVPGATGSYTFGQSSAPTDTVLIVYQGSFDKNTPSANAIAMNDDIHLAPNAPGTLRPAGVVMGVCGSSATQCPQLTLNLSAGTQYYVVTTTWAEGAALPLGFSFYVDGLAAVIVGGASPAPTSSFTSLSSSRSYGAAAVLDSLGGGSGGMANAIAVLSSLSPARQSAVLEKLTPSPSRAILVGTQNSLFSTFNQIGVRLDGLRLAEGAFNAPVLASGFGTATGLSAGDEPARHGFWLKGFGLESRQGQKDSFAGYASHGWGIATGIDRRLAPGRIVGVALSYADTSVDYRDQLDGDTSSIKSSQLSVYGSQDFGTFYVDGIIAYAKQRNKSERDTAISGTATGRYDGDQWGLRLSAGVPLAVSRGFTITPQARLEWNRINQDSYTENGGGALALKVDSNSADRLRTSLGAQLNYDTSFESLKLQPYVRAFWNHDFKNDGIDSAAAFVGGGGTFTTEGQQIDRNTYSVGLGANLFTRRNFTAAVGYDLTAGSSYLAHTAQATARWVF